MKINPIGIYIMTMTALGIGLCFGPAIAGYVILGWMGISLASLFF